MNRYLRFQKHTGRLNRWIVFSVACLIWTATSHVMGQFKTAYAIKGGKVLTVSGPVIEKGIVIIRDGLIEAVGTNLPIPPDAEVINADSLWIYPGLIDGYCPIALPGRKAENDKNITPGLLSGPAVGPPPILLEPEREAADGLNPKDKQIEAVRNAGVTTVLTCPSKGIFIGQSALINLVGDTPHAMIVRSPVALHMGFDAQRGTYPSTLMGVIAYQRQTFLDARHHKLVRERYQNNPQGFKRPAPSKSLDAIARALDGDQRIIFHANGENEIRRACKLADDFGLNITLCGAVEGWRITDLLASRGKPILVSLDFPEPEQVTGYAFNLPIEGPSQDEGKDPKTLEKEKKEKRENEMAGLYANAAALHKAGVTFGFVSAGLTKPEEFIGNAAKAVKHGLPADVALRALTLHTAQILGVDRQLGSIETGKIANLVLTTGDLFAEKTSVKAVFVDGKKLEAKAKQKNDKDTSGKSVLSVR